MRWAILAFIAGLAIAVAAAVLIRPGAGSQAPDPFYRWETCMLNNQPHCGPMPQP